MFPVYPYVHTIPTSSFRCRFVRLELLSPNLDFALTLLLIVVTRMSTYISPMYYAVLFSLIINVLSVLSFAWLLESSRLDVYLLSSPLDWPDSCAHPICHFCGACVFPRLTGHLLTVRYFLPVTGFRTTSQHPVIRP